MQTAQPPPVGYYMGIVKIVVTEMNKVCDSMASCYMVIAIVDAVLFFKYIVSFCAIGWYK